MEGVKFEKFQGNILELADKVNGYLEILKSGLIEATTFPPSFLSPELLQLCINHYDVRTKSILNKDGEPVLSISRETISSVLQLPESTFAAFSPTHSLVEYQEKPDKYRNMMARKWKEKNYKGDSRLPKIVTKDHMKPHVHDLMVLLHQVKGSSDVLLFKD